MSDLRDRVPGHSLVERLLAEWERGRIQFDGEHATVDEEVRSWYRGVHGERRVAEELAKLGPDWLVLHSVPVGRGDTDIDHVVVGTPGVFVINAKFSPGKPVWAKGYGVLVDGHRTGYVPKAIAEARRASDALSKASGLTVPVTAVIAFVDPGPLSIKGRVGGDEYEPEVRVVRHVDLPRLIAGRPVFSAEQATSIADAAIQPLTWHSSPRPASALSIAQEFSALEKAVGPALAGPSARASRDTVRRAPATRETPYRATRSRQAPPRPRGRSRRRKSFAERLIESLMSLAVPIAVLVAAWIYFNQLGAN
jgi:hypothetical protein